MSIAKDAKQRFLEAELAVKKQVLSVLLSNCSFRDRKITAVYRKPFDIIAERLPSPALMVGEEATELPRNAKWLPFVEDIRTALWENAEEISVTVAGIRAAGVIPLGVRRGSA